MHPYPPILATVGAAAASYLLLVLLDASALGTAPLRPWVAAWLMLGGLYAHLFEFWAHRIPMHRGFPLLQGVRRSHLAHHRIFHGERFRTRDPALLGHVAGRWWVFPLLLGTHFLVLRPVLPAAATAAFLFGCTVHYVLFEATHWWTHVDDNGFDRLLARVPWLREMRARQIEHHRRHHDVPEFAFNFSPPYLGDRILGLMPAPVAPPVVVAVQPKPIPAASAPAWVRPALAFGSALLVGAVVVGVAVFTHGRRLEVRAAAAAPDVLT